MEEYTYAQWHHDLMIIKTNIDKHDEFNYDDADFDEKRAQMVAELEDHFKKEPNH